MLVRNVSTDIRSSYGGVEEKGNSIFVFEVEGLCIGHLGHLHHVPSDEQFAGFGASRCCDWQPWIAGRTMPLARDDLGPQAAEKLGDYSHALVLWFLLGSLLVDIRNDFPVVREGVSELTVSLRSLPDRPTVVVLEPQYLIDLE